MKRRYRNHAYLPHSVELRVLTLDGFPEKVLGLVCLDKNGKEECTVVGDKQFFLELSESLRDGVNILDDYNGRPA